MVMYTILLMQLHYMYHVTICNVARVDQVFFAAFKEYSCLEKKHWCLWAILYLWIQIRRFWKWQKRWLSTCLHLCRTLISCQKTYNYLTKNPGSEDEPKEALELNAWHVMIPWRSEKLKQNSPDGMFTLHRHLATRVYSSLISWKQAACDIREVDSQH